mgnify:CR=1 FL=1
MTMSSRNSVPRTAVPRPSRSSDDLMASARRSLTEASLATTAGERYADAHLAALRAARGVKIFVCNIATQPGETEAYSCSDHVRALEEHVGEDLFERVIDGAMADHCHKTNPQLASRDDYRGMLAASM